MDVESTDTLLARVRAGESGAREVLFARYLPLLQRWARGRLPHHARDLLDTSDLVQMTLMRTLNKVDGFESRHEGAFLGYLRKQESLLMSIELGCTPEEIAQATGRPTAGAARVYVARAMIRLAEEMGRGGRGAR